MANHSPEPYIISQTLRRLARLDYPLEVRKGVVKAVLDNKTPVGVFFDCLPNPEGFERRLYENYEANDRIFKLACKHAVLSFEALTIARGMEEMVETFSDPLLDRLFRFMGRTACDCCDESRKKFSELAPDEHFNFMDQAACDYCKKNRKIPSRLALNELTRLVLQELVSIGSSIRRVICAGCSTELAIYQSPVTTKAFTCANNADLDKLGVECQNKACPSHTEGNEQVPGTVIPKTHPVYSEHTRRLLSYLSWLSHGRKDSEWRGVVNKFWDTGDRPANPWNSPNPDLSRLPLGLLEQQRQELRLDTKSLYRLAALFEIAFKHYILASASTSPPVSAVRVEDGIIKATVGTSRTSFDGRTVYAGIDPDLDLRLPEVQGALRMSCCREILQSARALFEHFFPDYVAMVEFIHFVPRNIHTPVAKVKEDQPASNMTPLHTVAVLTIDSGLRYVLDPSAAQYGWTEILAPLGIYEQCRVDHKDRTETFVPLDPQLPPTRQTQKPIEDPDERSRWRRRCAAEYTLKQVKGFMPDGPGSVIDRLQDDFDTYCEDLDWYLEVQVGEYSKQTPL